MGAPPIRYRRSVLDAATVRRAARGEARAWAHLTEHCGAAVWSLCVRLDPEPEDAWQEVWARVARTLERFDPGGPASVKTWIARIAHRLLVDRHRRRQARPRGGELPELPDHRDAEQALAHKQGVHRIEAALATLPPAWRRVVVRHHIDGVELEVLAADEGVAVGTIKSRLHRGRARLSELLEQP